MSNFGRSRYLKVGASVGDNKETLTVHRKNTSSLNSVGGVGSVGS